MDVSIYRNFESFTKYLKRYNNYKEEQVPVHFREPFIYSGYRDPKSSWLLCIKSLFFPTNETINIWTHLLPAFYFLSCFNSELLNLNAVVHDYYDIPYFIYLGTIVIYTMISSLAHLFNTMSDWARHVCFICDYAAVSIHAHGTALAIFAYSIPFSWINGTSNLMLSNNFILLSVLTSTFSVILSCQTRFQSANLRRKLLRFSAFMSPCLVTISPIFIRSFFSCIRKNSVNIHIDCKDDFYENLIYQIFFSLLAVIFYVTHVPERIYPGRFDILGHSHQLFHVTGTINTYFQMQLIKSDYLNRKLLLENHNRLPSFSNTYVPFIVVVSCNVLFSWIFILQLRHKMKNSPE